VVVVLAASESPSETVVVLVASSPVSHRESESGPLDGIIGPLDGIIVVVVSAAIVVVSAAIIVVSAAIIVVTAADIAVVVATTLSPPQAHTAVACVTESCELKMLAHIKALMV